MMVADNPTALARVRQRLRVLAALIIRETSARFGRSWGGYIWAIAEPTGGIVLLSVAFSVITHVPPRGTSFMYFYASGFVPFMMYNSIANVTMHAIRTNRGLLTYPVVRPLDTVISRATLEMMTHFVVALIIFPSIAWYDGVRTDAVLPAHHHPRPNDAVGAHLRARTNLRPAFDNRRGVNHR